MQQAETAKHMPGPWKVVHRTKRGTYGQPVRGCPDALSVESDSTVLFYGAVRANGDNLREVVASMTLAAAAPDLLAACNAVLDAYNQATPNWSVVANQCAAAIAKAEGGAL